MNHRTEPLQLSLIVPLWSKSIAQESGVAAAETEFREVGNENKLNAMSLNHDKVISRSQKSLFWLPNEGQKRQLMRGNGVFLSWGKTKKKKLLFS